MKNLYKIFIQLYTIRKMKPKDIKKKHALQLDVGRVGIIWRNSLSKLFISSTRNSIYHSNQSDSETLTFESKDDLSF